MRFSRIASSDSVSFRLSELPRSCVSSNSVLHFLARGGNGSQEVSESVLRRGRSARSSRNPAAGRQRRARS